MDSNKYVIGYRLWSVIEQPTNHVKTSLTMDLCSVTNAQNVASNEKRNNTCKSELVRYNDIVITKLMQITRVIED